MKKNNKLEKSYVDFLKQEANGFIIEKRRGLSDIADMYDNGNINNDSADLMREDEYRRFESAIENILCTAVARGCHYKSLYSIARFAFFNEYALDFLNNIIYNDLSEF